MKQEVANGRGPPPRDRPFRRGLLFSVLTLGLYALWWHRVVHKELCGYLGLPDREKVIWSFYVGFHVVVWAAFVGYVGLSVSSALGFSGPWMDRPVPAGVAMFVPVVFMGAAVGAVVLFVVHVRRQIRRLEDAKRLLDSPMRTTRTRFFAFYFGGIVVQTLTPYIGPVGVAFQPLAYWFLQEDYNDVHGESAQEDGPGGRPTTAPYGG